MATYTVKAPDGKTITLQGPDGASQSDIIAQAQRLYKPAAPAPSAPAPTGLYAGKDPAQVLQIYNGARGQLAAKFTDPAARQAALNRFDSDPRAQAMRKVAGLAPLSTAQGDVQAVAKKTLAQRAVDASVQGAKDSNAGEGFASGFDVGTFGIPQMLAAAGLRFLPSSITGNKSNLTYQQLLDIGRAHDEQTLSEHPVTGAAGAVAGTVASALATAPLAGAAAASRIPAVARVGNVLQNLTTLRKGQKIANVAKIASIGATTGSLQAAGTGEDIPTGAAEGALAAPVAVGGLKVAQVLTRPFRDVLRLSSAGQILSRLTSATQDQLAAKAAAYRGATGGEPTLFELLPLADRNRILKQAVVGKDNVVEQTSNAIRARAQNLGPEMSARAQQILQPQRTFIEDGMRNDIAAARGGELAPGDEEMIANAMESPTDMLNLRDQEAKAIMAPHETTPVVSNLEDLFPQVPGPGGTRMSTDPEAAAVIRSAAGTLRARPAGAGVTAGDITDMISTLKGDLGKGGIEGRTAERAINHLHDVLDSQAPAAGAAARQMSDAYAARSRMAEGMQEGSATRLRDDIQVGTSRRQARTVRNAYDTVEGANGRSLGQGNKIIGDLGGSPEEALRATVKQSRGSTIRPIGQNVGMPEAEQLAGAARAQDESAQALASASAKAQSGSGDGADAEMLVQAIAGLHPSSFITTKTSAVRKLFDMTYIPENRAKTMVDMLFSQNPALTRKAMKAIGNEPNGAKFMKMLAATVGQLTATASAPDTTPPPEQAPDADGAADASAEAPTEAQEAPADVMGYPVVTNPDKSTWDKRADGSTKGTGFLGLLQRPDGSVSSEISVGVGINGKETEIPLMVPGLTKPELDYLMTHDPASAQFQKNMPRSILDKATAHATARINAGLSPFKQDDEPTNAAAPPASASPYAPALLQIYQNENPDLIHLIQRVKQQESSGDQSAVSKKGAVGVMQIMPGTGPEAAKLAGVQWDPAAYKNDAAYNELLGIAYLSQLLRKYNGDVARALAAYNAGPDKTDKTIATHGDSFLSAMPAETQDYVAKVG